MPAKTIPTSLGLCGECIDNPDVDGQCECAVDMRVCAGCDRGPLNDSEDDCGECNPSEEDGFCCLTLARSGTCSCPDREQHVGR